jgi:hypothetical protein
MVELTWRVPFSPDPPHRAKTRLVIRCPQLNSLPYDLPLLPLPILFAGGADLPLARSGVPTPGGVRGRAVIGDRTRIFPSACTGEAGSLPSLSDL